MRNVRYDGIVVLKLSYDDDMIRTITVIRYSAIASYNGYSNIIGERFGSTSHRYRM